MSLGIKKLRTNKLSFRFFISKAKIIEFNKSLEVTLKLHKFLKKNEFEFDVFRCDSFLESPGTWLK